LAGPRDCLDAWVLLLLVAACVAMFTAGTGRRCRVARIPTMIRTIRITSTASVTPMMIGIQFEDVELSSSELTSVIEFRVEVALVVVGVFAGVVLVVVAVVLVVVVVVAVAVLLAVVVCVALVVVVVVVTFVVEVEVVVVLGVVVLVVVVLVVVVLVVAVLVVAVLVVVASTKKKLPRDGDSSYSSRKKLNARQKKQTH
jgi:hypothetical protein